MLGQLQGTVPLERKRVGLVALERVPVREHTELQDAQGQRIGEVTSGLLGPTDRQAGRHGLCRRRARRPRHAPERHRARQAGADGSGAMPFVPHRYYRG